MKYFLQTNMNYKYSGIENDLYLRAQLQHMVKNPSESRAQKIEDTFDDCTVDFRTADFGEAPSSKFYPTIVGECEELEF